MRARIKIVANNIIICFAINPKIECPKMFRAWRLSSAHFSSAQLSFTSLSYPFEIIVCPGPNNSRCIDLVPTELERTSGCVNWYLMASHTSIHHITSHMHVSARAGCRRKWLFLLYGVDAFSVKGTKKTLALFAFNAVPMSRFISVLIVVADPSGALLQELSFSSSPSMVQFRVYICSFSFQINLFDWGVILCIRNLILMFASRAIVPQP